MQLIHYTLPEWVFFDGHSHQGNSLENRTVIMHIRTGTIIEVVALDEVLQSHFVNPTYQFTYKNLSNIIEHHQLIVHHSLIWESPLPANSQLQEIFSKAKEWYCNYLTWEDSNL